MAITDWFQLFETFETGIFVLANQIRPFQRCYSSETIKKNEKKDEYKLDKHEVSKPPFFLSFRHSKCIVLSDFSSDLFRLHSCRE